MSLHLRQQPYVLRIAIAGVAAAILGACSPDIERFGATDRTPVGTTLVPPQTIAAGSGPSITPANRAAPVRAVTATPLQPIPASGPRAGVIPASRGGVSGTRFAAPAAKSPAIAAGARNLAAASQFPTGTARNLTSHGRWSPKGGTAVTLAQGESLKTLERRYGVPAKTLMKVNGLTSGAQAKPGSRIVIPVYNRSGNVATASKNAANSRRKVATAARSRSTVIPPSRPSRLGKKVKSGSSKNLKRFRSAGRAPVARANDKNNASAESWQLSTLSELTKQPVLERYELACFWLPTLSHELLHQYIPALMRYRDLYAAHLLVALDDSIDLKPYGFTPFDILDEPLVNIGDIESITSATVSATFWQFNLYDYKQLPNWLNADYWANPENWGKHRW